MGNDFLQSKQCTIGFITSESGISKNPKAEIIHKRGSKKPNQKNIPAIETPRSINTAFPHRWVFFEAQLGQVKLLSDSETSMYSVFCFNVLTLPPVDCRLH